MYSSTKNSLFSFFALVAILFLICIAYCSQNLKTGELLELVPSEDDLEIGGVKYGDYKEELLRIEPADFSSWPEGTLEHIFGDV